jgi:hypothetical protein
LASPAVAPAGLAVRAAGLVCPTCGSPTFQPRYRGTILKWATALLIVYALHGWITWDRVLGVTVGSVLLAIVAPMAAVAVGGLAIGAVWLGWRVCNAWEKVFPPWRCRRCGHHHDAA